jgi:Ca-activated chloride channel family protein
VGGLSLLHKNGSREKGLLPCISLDAGGQTTSEQQEDFEMIRYKWMLFIALGMSVGLPAWLARNGSPVKAADAAYAATTADTPGKLTIVNKEGKPAGLCPLKHTDVKADIAGYVARVTVTQEFTNPLEEPIEAIYTFPLPGDAAVDDMTMRLGDRVIKGQIMRREEAREVYEAAKASGQAAALLDQERPNIFTQSVANIMPGETVRMTISYVNLLKYEEGIYEFNFPMVVGPRYVPGGGYSEPEKRGEPGLETAQPQENTGTQAIVKDAGKITPPITPPDTRAGHDISVQVTLDAGLPIQDVRSVLHAVDVRRQGRNRSIITLRNKAEIPNKDFILRYRVAGSEVQSGILTHAQDGSGYFTLILQPPAAPPRDAIAPKEMVFVIDQTGSQSGWPIEKAKETMRQCVQNMNPGDTFQLLAFNTEVYPCFPQAVPNTPANVQKALAFLKPLEGNGGTDILKSVDYALKMPGDPKRLRIICYMTDGYVGNDMQIIDHVRKNRGQARMFVFGIGNSVNRFLIDNMAKEGRGAAEYVTLQEQGSEAAMKFYRRIADPILLDPQVEWNGLPVADIYPEAVPDVFSAGPIILKGRYTQAANGSITVKGLLRGRPWSQTIKVSLPAQDQDGSAIATLWAREKIEHLQSQDWLGAQTGNPNAGIKDQIVATALEYRLMTQYTSFVAVEEKVVNVNGQLRTVDVPVEMPEGVSYEGIFGDVERADALTAYKAGRVSQNYSLYFSGGASGGAGASPPASTPSLSRRAKGSELEESKLGVGIVELQVDKAIAEGKEEALKQLQALSPEERRKALLNAKVASSLRDKLTKSPASTEKTEVQIWLNSLPKDGLDKLKALGFELAAELKPSKLLLGTITLDKLDKIIELTFVRRVEPPKMK